MNQSSPRMLGTSLGLAVYAFACSAPRQAASTAPLWWLGTGAGAGRVHGSGDAPPSNELGSGWRLAFSGGLALDEHWLLGLELGGLGLEAGDLWDPTKGRALSDTFLTTEYHPSLAGGWYLHAGAGLLTYRNNAPGAGEHDGSGPGLRLGVGYEWPAGERWHLGLLAAGTTGTIEAEDRWRSESIALTVVASWR